VLRKTNGGAHLRQRVEAGLGAVALKKEEEREKNFL
jgi:hypothetical protein